jgi:hypothetical protein
MNQESVLQMTQLQEQVLKRAIAMLEGIKCSYAIIDPLGNKHGLLDVKEPAVRGGRKHPHGERSGYVRGFISAMKVGDSMDLPIGKYEVVDVQSSIHSAARNLWGKGSITTTMNKPKRVFEILRVF